MKITAKQACAAYMKRWATCPFCGGDILAGEMTGEGDCQFQETYCGTCKAAFSECYKLKSVIIEHGPEETDAPNVKEYVQ